MILVIGGTGTTGREVVRLLAARSEKVRVLVRDPFKASFLAAPGVEVFQADLARPASLTAAFDGARRLFLVTPPAPDMVELQAAAVAAARKT
ncbi:MAG: SDR family oxidoreductase, partial [Gemmatimonadales bacterium]